MKRIQIAAVLLAALVTTPALAEGTLTLKLLEIANVGAEWVLYVLIGLSVMSVGIMLERVVFYSRNRLDLAKEQSELMRMLSRGEYKRAATHFRGQTAMEAQVIAVGLERHEMGTTASGELMSGALTAQKQRYERYLSVLASVGSNAPFIGLFGTVLGIIQAFGAFDLKGGQVDGIMYAISEALVATGVGLLVAIPAVIGYNLLKGRVKKSVGGTDQLVRVLTAHLTARAEGHVSTYDDAAGASDTQSTVKAAKATAAEA